MKQYLTIGQIIASWGVKGQIKIEPLTDDLKRFKDLKTVFVKTHEDMILYKVQSAIFLKKENVVLKLEGIESMDEADRLRGYYLQVHRKDAIKLPKDRYFICDIIGLEVYTEEDEFLGTITDVLQTGANDVYIVHDKNKREILIPAIKEVVKNIDIYERTMVIRPLEGMF